MEARRILGWNVRRIRVEQHMTIEELAGRADIDSSHVARIERGTVNSSLDVMAKLAKVLRVRLADLVTDPPPGTSKPAPLRAGRKPSSR